jgi:membrane protein implicated in regulation of membrane protease activity
MKTLLFFLLLITVLVLPEAALAAQTTVQAGFLQPIIGAIALAVGAFVPGFQFLIPLGISMLVSFAASMLIKPAQDQPQTQMPQTQGQITIDQKQTVRQPTAPRKIVYGQTRVGGTYAYLNVANGNQYLYYVICYAGHEVEEIGDIWFDEDIVPIDPDGNVRSGRYAGSVYLEKHLGASDQAASQQMINQNPGQWTQDHRLQGIAYICGWLVWNNTSGDGTVGQNVWSGGLPNITAVIKGKKVYDPRTNSIQYSNNSALVAADYLTDPLYGLAIDRTTGLHQDGLIAAANSCDEPVARIDGTTEPRYTTDGMFQSDATPDNIIGQLVGAMQGKAVYDGDQWVIYAGVYQNPELILTDDDMRKASTIMTLTSSRDACNGVKGTFVGPDNKWQAADFPPVISETFKELDGNYELIKDIQLPFTISSGRAQRIAKIQLLHSRQEIVETFSGKLSCWRVRTGSTILRTSERYGWLAKPFEVNATNFVVDNDANGNPVLGIDITLSETDPTIYDWSTNEEFALDSAPNTNFPDYFTALPPTPPFTVSEQLYFTDNGFRSRGHFAWGPSPDLFVEKGGSYALRFRIQGDLEWNSVPLTRVTYYDVLDIAPGLYEAEVRSVNWANQLSTDFLGSTFEILGVLAAPDNPQNLNVIPLSGGTVAHATWDVSQDIDVIMGGFIEFHHSPQFSDVLWSTTTRISTRLPGNSTETLLPLKAGTYCAKFVDVGGTYSDMTEFVQFQSSVLSFTTVGSIVEDPTFAGTKTNCSVSAGFIRINDGGMSATYDFHDFMDMTTVQNVRVTSYIDAVIENRLDTIDSRLDLIDNWASFDGDVAGNESDFWLEMRMTSDDPAGTPTWTSWQRFHTVEAEARAFQFRGQFTTLDPGFTPAVHQLNVVAEALV